MGDVPKLISPQLVSYMFCCPNVDSFAWHVLLLNAWVLNFDSVEWIWCYTCLEAFENHKVLVWGQMSFSKIMKGFGPTDMCTTIWLNLNPWWCQAVRDTCFFTKIDRGYHITSFETSFVKTEHICWQKTKFRKVDTKKKIFC